MAVPNIFGSATSAIPLSQLDTNFATPVTIGNTAVQLGNTVTSFGNVTLTNVTVSSGNVTITGANVSGNLTFTGTGNRITGDFSNATVASRVAFQTSTTNGNTQLSVIPNGTGTQGIIDVYANSDPTNTNRLQLISGATFTSIRSGITGTGTNLPMTFFTGGSESVRIDTSGNVGIGTASPASKLDVTATIRAVSSTPVAPTSGKGVEIWYETSGDYGRIATYDRTGAAYKNQYIDSAALYLNSQSAGAVGIGTSSLAGYRVSVKQSGNTSLASIGIASINSANDTYIGMGYNATSDTCRIVASYDTGGAFKPITFLTSDAERMRIDTSGNLLVGTTDSSGTVGAGFKVLGGRPVTVNAASTDGTTVYELYSTGASAYRFYVGMGGTVFATQIVITAISDERLKENVRDINTGLDAIMALKPRRFDWKEGKGQDKKDVAGFIAQEFETVFPECVSTSLAGEDGIEYKNINHETLIPTLVKAIQEQQALIQSLTTRITALENK